MISTRTNDCCLLPPSSMEPLMPQNHEAVDHSPKTVLCKVCNVPTENKIKCGALVCDACKKFFLRNYQRRDDRLLALRCTSNNGTKCLTSAAPKRVGRSSGILSSSGSILRLICPKCRLDKCFNVGMRVLGWHSKRLSESPLVSKTTSDRRDSTTPSNSSDCSLSLRQSNNTVKDPIEPAGETTIFSPFLSAAGDDSTLAVAESQLLLTLLACQGHPSLGNSIAVGQILEQLRWIHRMATDERGDIGSRVRLLRGVVDSILLSRQ